MSEPATLLVLSGALAALFVAAGLAMRPIHRRAISQRVDAWGPDALAVDERAVRPWRDYLRFPGEPWVLVFPVFLVAALIGVEAGALLGAGFVFGLVDVIRGVGAINRDLSEELSQLSEEENRALKREPALFGLGVTALAVQMLAIFLLMPSLALLAASVI